MISREKIISLIEPVLNEKKFFIVSLTISNSNRIILSIDGMNAVRIEDCVQLSRIIEHGLDRNEEDFELEVSSAGLDIPLTVHQQYLKNIGRNVSIQHSDGIRTEGKLLEATDEDFKIEYKRKERIEGKKKKQTIIENKRYKYSEVQNVKLVISFK